MPEKYTWVSFFVAADSILVTPGVVKFVNKNGMLICRSQNYAHVVTMRELCIKYLLDFFNP